MRGGCRAPATGCLTAALLVLSPAPAITAPAPAIPAPAPAISAPAPAIAAPRAPAPAPAGPSLALVAAPRQIHSGGTTGLTGVLLDPRGARLAGAGVELQVDPFPYRGFFDAAHTTTAADGSYGFPGLHPDRNTRYRVRSPVGLSRVSVVYVDAPGILHAYDRGPGRTMLTMLSYHSAFFRWVGVPTYWYVAPLGRRDFRLAAVTRTRELKPGVTYATATVDPPARRFTFRVCFNAAGEAGSGPPAGHPRCPHGDFRARPATR